MRRAVPLVLLAAVFNSGCLVASLHPAYDKASIRFDPALIGMWEDEDRQSSLAIEAGPWQSYRVTVTVQSRETPLTVHEMRIGDARFVDLTPEHGLEASPIAVPTHALARFTLTGDRLELRPLDYDWFRRMIEEKALKGLSASLDERENVLVTSPASGLRTWIGAHLMQDAVFGAPLRFSRRK